jgi:hypothetical protein
MPIMKECNSGEWLKEAKKRLDRLTELLAVDRKEQALAEARELVAAAQILYGEVVNEQAKGGGNGRATT